MYSGVQERVCIVVSKVYTFSEVQRFRGRVCRRRRHIRFVCKSGGREPWDLILPNEWEEGGFLLNVYSPDVDIHQTVVWAGMALSYCCETL